MEFDEVSLVTRPANQMSKVVLFKSDEAISEEEQVNPEDQVEEVEAVVAEEVAAEEVVEKAKKKMPAMDAEEMGEEQGADESDADYAKRMKAMNAKMAKSNDEDSVEIPSEVYDYIEALESANAELVEQVSKMTSEMNESAEAIQAEIFKSADPRMVELVKGLEDRVASAEAIAKAERDHRLEQEFVAKASTLTNLSVKAEEFGVILKGVADRLTDEQYDAIWQVISSANANLSKSGLFAEFGKSSTTDNDGPMSIIEKAAATLRQSNPTMTREQSIAKAVSADTNLYNQYLRDGK